MARDSGDISQVLRGRGRGGNRGSAGRRVKRLKKARCGCSGSSSQVPQPRQTCSSGRKPGEFHGPETEVGDGAPDGTGIVRSAGVREPCVSRRKYFSLGSAAGSSCSETSAKKSSAQAEEKSWRTANCECDEIAGIDIDQFAILALKVRHSDVRKPFQAGSETAFGPSRAAGDAPQFAQIAGQES